MGVVYLRRHLLLPAMLLAAAAGALRCSALADASPAGSIAYTITGSVRTADGQPPQSGSLVFVYKIDAAMTDADNFMQYPDIDDALAPNATYQTQTDRDGDFSITLFGPEVAAADGSLASIAVVFFADGERTTPLATATGWLELQASDTELDVGTLQLWNAGTAALNQTTGVITFDWSAPAAPQGEQRATDMPSHLYAWDTGSVAANPRWAGYTFESSVDVPRAAFADANPYPPHFFVTSVSRATVGGLVFQHRTAVKVDIRNWTATVQDTDLTGQASFKVGSPAVPLARDAITDGDLDTMHQFIGAPRQLYIDLGTSCDVAHLLLHRLSVAPAGDGSAPVILLSASSDNVADPAAAQYQSTGASIGGDWAYERGYYVAASNLGQARWLRLQVEASDTAEPPALASLAEIRVFGP